MKLNELKQLIRENIKLVLTEMFADRHFLDRVNLRLKSQYTNFTDESPEFQEKVFESIDFLVEKVLIKNVDLGIYIKCPKTYTAYDPQEKKFSKGNVIWMVTFDNHLTSIFFDYSNYNSKRDYNIDFDRLKNYIVTSNKYVLDEKDFKKIFSPKKEESKKEENVEEIVLTINGVKYVLNYKKGIFYPKNKPQKIYDPFDVVDDKVPEIKLDDQTKEKIMDLII